MAAVGVDVVIVVVESVEAAGLAVQAACASMVHIKININRSLVVILGLLGSSDTKRQGDRNGSLTFIVRRSQAKARVSPLPPGTQSYEAECSKRTILARAVGTQLLQEFLPSIFI